MKVDKNGYHHLHHWAGNMGWPATGSEAFAFQSGLQLAAEWVRARLSNAKQYLAQAKKYGWQDVWAEKQISQCMAWLDEARKYGVR